MTCMKVIDTWRTFIEIFPALHANNLVGKTWRESAVMKNMKQIFPARKICNWTYKKRKKKAKQSNVINRHTVVGSLEPEDSSL